jgi:hypothetical protein
LGADAPARNENFRIDNEVFSDGHKEPTARSTTIFCDGIVYDYLETPEETVVFDKARRRIVLLDGRRRMRAELTTNAIVTFTERLKQDAQKQQDPLLKFSAAPKLDEKFDADARELTLSSRWLTYRLLLEDAEREAVAQQVREFSDWFAQLNTLLNPGTRLPFARMLVNETLANRGAIAREVYLTMSSSKGSHGKPTTVRSRHRLSRELTASDLSRVAQTRQLLDVFKPVSFDEYRKTGKR